MKFMYLRRHFPNNWELKTSFHMHEAKTSENLATETFNETMKRNIGGKV